MQFSVANFKSKVGCIDFSFNIIQFSFNTFSYNLALITWSIILNFKSPLQSLKNIFIWIDQMMRLLLHMVFLKMKKLKHSFFYTSLVIPLFRTLFKYMEKRNLFIHLLL